MVGRTNEWVANPLGLRQTSALQIKTRSAYFGRSFMLHAVSRSEGIVVVSGWSYWEKISQSFLSEL